MLFRLYHYNLSRTRCYCCNWAITHYFFFFFPLFQFAVVGSFSFGFDQRLSFVPVYILRCLLCFSIGTGHGSFSFYFNIILTHAPIWTPTHLYLFCTFPHSPSVCLSVSISSLSQPLHPLRQRKPLNNIQAAPSLLAMAADSYRIQSRQR